ncbi:MAG: glycine cleavage system protein R [Acidobacteria bacterium]|nr:MAG: glycine cleavage system protein R [Acidobacteriota bacterium]
MRGRGRMEDKDNVILTAVGPDKIGLVEKISEFIVQQGCNIEDSKMAVFCGEFALIVLISGGSKNLLKIANGYNELETLTGLTVWVKRPSSKKPAEPSLPYKLTASCMDHPGVVHRLSRVLSLLAINIESMETKTYLAPVSGTPIFRLEALISIPAKLNVKALRGRFAEIEREENIDIDLSLQEEGA